MIHIVYLENCPYSEKALKLLKKNKLKFKLKSSLTSTKDPKNSINSKKT